MARVFQTQRRVEFRDTDAAGIMHFSVFFVYMEQTEHEFLRHLGQSVVSQVEGKTVSWPRVSAKCDYRRPIRFEQTVNIETWVEQIGSKSVCYGFRFCATAELESTTADEAEIVAEGSITAVCCEVEHGKPPVPIPIPNVIVEKLTPYKRT